MATLLVKVWVDLRPVSAYGVELYLLLVGAWGGAKVLGKSDYVECVRSEEFRKCVEGKMNPAIVLQV